MYKYNIWYLYCISQHNNSILNTTVGYIYLCGSTATCFDPVGSSSGNHYMNMSLVIGLFTDMVQIGDLYISVQFAL
jgi:hypothetical protein